MDQSSIIDIQFVKFLPRLRVFACNKVASQLSVSDLMPLLDCPKLTELSLRGNITVDLSPLGKCLALEILDISFCSKVESVPYISTLKAMRVEMCFNLSLRCVFNQPENVHVDYGSAGALFATLSRLRNIF
jgi:Leucine-rich repeat (LRR) protein